MDIFLLKTYRKIIEDRMISMESGWPGKARKV